MCKIKKEVKVIFFYVLLFALLYLSWGIIKPFIGVIVVSSLVAYIVHPIYKILHNKIKSENLSSFLVTLFVTLLVLLPLIFGINTLSNESVHFYNDAKVTLQTFDCPASICGFFMQGNVLSGFLDKINSFAVALLSGVALSIPAIMINVFLLFLLTFYLIKDGKKIFLKIIILIPLGDDLKNKVILDFKNITWGVFYGSLLVAVVQSFIAWIGMNIFGITNSPYLFALLIAIFSFVPFIGSSIVYVPLSLMTIIPAWMANDVVGIWKGVGFLIYCIILVSLSDNVIKPKIISDRSKIHPLVTFIGVFGGLATMGFVGIIIGPLILSTLITFMNYKTR